MSDHPVDEAYLRCGAVRGRVPRITAAAGLLLEIFDEFYRQLREYPFRAKRAFETRDWHTSLHISRERLGLYSRFIAEHGPRIREQFPELSGDAEAWDELDRLFVAMIVDRYEADIAFSFAHSMRRNIVRELWRPVAYSFPPPSRLRARSMAPVHRRLMLTNAIDETQLRQALEVACFEVPFRDLALDTRRVRARLADIMQQRGTPPVALDMIEAGFFRDRGAFVVGRWVFADDTVMPFVVALLNGAAGIFTDAILHRTAEVHAVFSSTLANLHVTTDLYYQTCVFLRTLMPRRPLSEHYSTIGYNHVGKVAILNEITAQLDSGRRFAASPGAAGTVALGFTFEGSAYHLKVIRDRPTQSYKWGQFPGVAAVEDKYRIVHEIDRAGSMLDNVMYYNLRLERRMFEPSLLEEICAQAAGSAKVVGDGVFLRSLIVQLKIVPLPLYLERASDTEIGAAMVSLGICIRNNAAANLFNRDLDSRNYGVGRYGRVFLFDYDAVEKLTEVKIRTNADREPGEDEVPAWFFEDGVIFLPEELEYGMQFRNDFARHIFRRENGDLLTVPYWEDMQQRLLRGEVPALRMYADHNRLHTTDGC